MVETSFESGGVRVLPYSHINKYHELKVPADGKGYYIIQESTIFHNNALEMTLQIGTLDLEQSSLLKVLQNIISQIAYDELNVKESLGLLTYLQICKFISFFKFFACAMLVFFSNAS